MDHAGRAAGTPGPYPSRYARPASAPGRGAAATARTSTAARSLLILAAGSSRSHRRRLGHSHVHCPKFGFELQQALAATTDSIEARRRRMNQIDLELARLAEAIATQGAAPVVLKTIAARETERKSIEQALWGAGENSVQNALSDIREFAATRLKDLRTILRGQVQTARFELGKHVDQIVMHPIGSGGDKHYVAEGEWGLVGKYEGRPGAALRNLEMVAGTCNALKIPSIPFRLEIPRPSPFQLGPQA